MSQPNSAADPDVPQPGPRILILADDLTGGNACGALFAEAGLRTMTITGTGGNDSISLDGMLDDYDTVVVNANSRHMDPAEAASLTDALVRIAGPVDLVSCRIDTTLRGNVGPTAEAALRARQSLASESGPSRVMGLCLPAFPSSGRVTVGGQQLLNGQLLEHTELAHDVRSPMTTSVVEDILRLNTDLKCHTIELSTVLDGKQAIRADVVSAIAVGAEVIVADAMTNEHISLIAATVVDLSREVASTPAGAPGENARLHANLRHGERLEWVSIDPGPGSLALSRALLPARETGIILGVSGSATEITRAQLAKLDDDPTITVLRTINDADALPDVDATVEQVRAVASAQLGSVQAIILATVVDASDLLELTDEQSEIIPRRLAQITAEVMASPAPSVTGLYTTGGDVTAAVLREVDAIGMEIEAEIIPLAVGGRIVGGTAAGLPIVTKGGLIGDSDTTALCLDHLQKVARIGLP
ncbi:four-carbon acid sugar kinase family protein [Brevibacterium antiquum]|uniref:Uncharacterized conserved protein YgbK, DUF1537 family n=2 Tax=Brevibacterium antiquum TaxID=234835 RepID=A0A2H1JRL6_9MICO|nr:four-carbon acid sugar kinase family protein [Brevibacterium antiquum]SMX90103.1 Uncharacterized conserved protein YgbK, DUF1537 family [Brevibacterium antiquum CNRZ 918]SMX99772.1 Uncharacterized conserved protein YgbK, DUF1537 family [Brevibacterium antiquum]